MKIFLISKYLFGKFEYLIVIIIWNVEFCLACLLSFGKNFQLFSFDTILVLSFVAIRVIEFCCYLCFWILSQLEILDFVTVWVFEILCYLRLVTTLFFLVLSRVEVLGLSQFVFLSFVTIWLFDFWHILIKRKCPPVLTSEKMSKSVLNQ